jgi:hypothetical protein
VAAKDRMNGNKWGVFSNTTRCFTHLGMGKNFCERKAAELNGGPAVVMTKLDKLREAYQRLKAGWTLRYGSMAVCWIDTCERYGSPSYGKEYIYWQGYGRSAETVSMKNFKWLLDVIFEVTDYEDYTIED